LEEFFVFCKKLPFTIERITLAYPFGQVQALRFGRGPRLLIGIHGFADRSTAFLQLEPALGELYTIYCIDLPFHGETVWSKRRFTREHLAGILLDIAAQTGHDRFSVMGHSMGGRILLSLLPLIGDRLDQMLLFAPAGLQKRLLFARLLTPLWLRRWARRIMLNWDRLPGWFYRLKRWRIIPRYAAGLAELHFSSLPRRQRLLNTWVSLYDFPIRPMVNGRYLRRYQVNTWIYLGEHDRAIPPAEGQSFVACFPEVHLRIINENHFLMTETLCEALRQDFPAD
jgi:pimeloyl-ACP methyl ester carboxylesterase